jgi:hypothetical protein
MTCPLCDRFFGDDPHWHDDLETWVCETCCPSCLLSFPTVGIAGTGSDIAELRDDMRTLDRGIDALMTLDRSAFTAELGQLHCRRYAIWNEVMALEANERRRAYWTRTIVEAAGVSR